MVGDFLVGEPFKVEEVEDVAVDGWEFFEDLPDQVIEFFLDDLFVGWVGVGREDVSEGSGLVGGAF